MPDTIKIIGSELALSTANTVNLATVVRCYNNTGAPVTITRAAGAVTLGTLTLPNGSVEYYQKLPTETIASSGAIKASAVAFS